MFVGGASFLLDLRRLFVAHLRLVDDRHVLALVLEPMGDRRIAPVAAAVDHGELCHVSLAGCDTGIHRAWCRYGSRLAHRPESETASPPPLIHRRPAAIRYCL